MDTTRIPPGESPFASVRRFVRRAAPVERCELCKARLAPSHSHLIDPVSRELRCSCEACALLFSNAQGARFRRVPRRIRALHDFELSDAQWDDLAIPIAMAFFFHSSPAGRVIAIYPSPAGPTMLYAGGVGSHRVGEPGAAWARARCGSAARQSHSRRKRLVEVFHGANRRVLQARRPDQGELARPFGWRRSLGGYRGVLCESRVASNRRERGIACLI